MSERRVIFFFLDSWLWGVLVGWLAAGNVYMYTRDKENNKMGWDDGNTPPLPGQATDGKGLKFMIYTRTHSSNDSCFYSRCSIYMFSD